MFKRFLRWTLPLIVLTLIAMYLAFSPVLASHAATPVSNHQTTAPVIQLHNDDDATPQGPGPNMRWRP